MERSAATVSTLSQRRVSGTGGLGSLASKHWPGLPMAGGTVCTRAARWAEPCEGHPAAEGSPVLGSDACRSHRADPPTAPSKVRWKQRTRQRAPALGDRDRRLQERTRDADRRARTRFPPSRACLTCRRRGQDEHERATSDTQEPGAWLRPCWRRVPRPIAAALSALGAPAPALPA